MCIDLLKKLFSWKETDITKSKKKRGREEYFLWENEQYSLPREKPSDFFVTQKNIYEQEARNVSNAERDELIRRLKAMSEEEVLPPEQRPMGAMCYCPRVPDTTYVFTCPKCGRIVKELYYCLDDISLYVKEIKKMGYDVKIERLCSICSGRKGEHPLDVDILFYFRFKGMKAYHIAVANYSEDYQIVLAFLRSENTYKGDRDKLEYVSEHKDVIEKMLGIKI